MEKPKRTCFLCKAQSRQTPIIGLLDENNEPMSLCFDCWMDWLDNGNADRPCYRRPRMANVIYM